MPYSDAVVDHFTNPRNVGSLDQDAPDVGTGIVGAPECFSRDTLIATADGTRHQTIGTIYDSQEIIPVWSFNIDTGDFEIQKARAVYSGVKTMHQVFLSDGGTLTTTSDHEFLVRPTNEYLENGLISDESIWTFRRYVSKRGYWRIRRTEWQEEYKAIYKFSHKIGEEKGNIHHSDHDKRHDVVSNLEYLSLSDHIKKHDLITRFEDPDDKCCRRIKKHQATKTRAEISDILDIHTDELYFRERRCGLSKSTVALQSEIYEMTSKRMKENNPYSNFTKEQKQRFACHPGSLNGRWIDVNNDVLLHRANELYKRHGKLTRVLWTDFAKQNHLPQRVDSTTRFSSWNNFKRLATVEYNHKILSRGDTKSCDAFTLQVEKNNNYVVLTNLTKNIEEGIVVKNCGDVLKLQIRVDDDGNIIESKFKTFGCGSAIASSSLVSEWIKGRTVDEALSIKNTAIVKELALPPVKIHCSVLAEDAVRAAIDDWKKKQEEQKETNEQGQ